MSFHDYNEFAAAGGNLNAFSGHLPELDHSRDPDRSAKDRPHRQGSSDALAIYLREVGDYELLTGHEEVELAGRVQRGDKEAYERMVCGNLRLVIKIAQHYEGLGLALLDLISEGNLGLMRAVDLFDPAKGAKLSSYSSWWIKQSMRRALSDQSKTIRLPVNATDKIYRLRHAARKLEGEFHREPTNAELAAEVGLKPARVAHLRSATMAPLSLDSPLSDHGDSQLGDILSDENSIAPDAWLEMAELMETILGMIPTLSSREATILRHYFALEGNKEMTLETLGRKLGFTRERIRQIKAEALVKLRTMLDEMDRVTGPAKVRDAARHLHKPIHQSGTSKKRSGPIRTAHPARTAAPAPLRNPALGTILERCPPFTPIIRSAQEPSAPQSSAQAPGATHGAWTPDDALCVGSVR